MTEVIEKRLESLSYYQILAFYVLVIKRQIPNYYSFFQKENWGNPEILELGIRLLENIALERSVLEYDESLIDDISNITPDSEEFDSILATSAQDVCVMLIEALESVSSQDTE
ncbi:MAG: DUF416 family protein, partial [Leptospiraceae bacterium]|nr:DUF416 family protein [Leptospiraceae bacterium]